MSQPRMRLFVFVAALTAAVQASPRANPAAGPVPVLENVDLMDLMVKPAYDELQRAAARPPADRQAWAALYQKAARLAEIENLLFFRTRSGNERKSEWSERAGRARDAAADVAALALIGLRSTQAADFDRVRAAFPAIAAACTACHRAFAREAPTIKP